MVLPECSNSKIITTEFSVLESSHDSIKYDMIILSKTLSDMGILLDFRSHEIIWDKVTVSMKAPD